jgi:hypothetical protein
MTYIETVRILGEEGKVTETYKLQGYKFVVIEWTAYGATPSGLAMAVYRNGKLIGKDQLFLK